MGDNGIREQKQAEVQAATTLFLPETQEHLCLAVLCFICLADTLDFDTVNNNLQEETQEGVDCPPQAFNMQQSF
jgi:hypothetical protein